jgi:hypothetical protein
MAASSFLMTHLLSRGFRWINESIFRAVASAGNGTRLIGPEGESVVDPTQLRPLMDIFALQV